MYAPAGTTSRTQAAPFCLNPRSHIGSPRGEVVMDRDGDRNEGGRNIRITYDDCKVRVISRGVGALAHARPCAMRCPGYGSGISPSHLRDSIRGSMRWKCAYGRLMNR